MANTSVLPDGYAPLLSIDLQKDKRLALLVNGLALLIFLVGGFLGRGIVPLSTLWDMTDGLLWYFLRFGVLLVGCVVYMLLHELVHGLCMRHFSGMRPHYGFTGLYAYAGSDAYFDRRSYLLIALAPIVVWGLVLTVLLCLVPTAWFWVVYGIQLANLSGAAGDLYVALRFRRLPAAILVQDSGVAMTVYAPTP